MQNVDSYFATARERYHLMLEKREGLPAPWTSDPIFQEWRFCCVHREDDRTTAWFRENIRSKMRTPLDAAAATVAFRWFNRIETCERIKDVLLAGHAGWNSNLVYARLKDAPGPVTNGAYIICGQQGYDKLGGVVQAIDVAMGVLPSIIDDWGDSLQMAHADLKCVPYLGRFMAYEVITDLRWTPALTGAQDINTWASAGPGCARGLGRVVDGQLNRFSYGSASSQDEMIAVMRELLAMSQDANYWPSLWKSWEMREVEHWACEFDKYERARAGARLKRRYP